MTDMSPLEHFKRECADRSAAADTSFKIHCTPETVAKYIDLYTRIRYDEKCYGTNKHVHFIKRWRHGFVTDPIILPISKAGRLSKGDLMEIKMAEFDINSGAVRRINDPPGHGLQARPHATARRNTGKPDPVFVGAGTHQAL